MAFSYNTHNNKTIGVFAEEGKLREALAAYFLAAPLPERRTPEQQTEYKRALRRLAEVEVFSLLQSASIRRPLRYGDVNALLCVTLEACARRFEEKNITLQYNLPDKSICTAAEPRLITTALIHLLRAVSAVNPEKGISAYVTLHEHSLSLSVCGDNPIKSPKILPLIHAAARLHKGGVAVSDGTVAFSIRLDLPGAVGLFAAPGIDELLKNPLSTVNVVLD